MADLSYALPDKQRQPTPAEEACAYQVKQKFMQEAAWRNMFAQQWEEVAAMIFPEHRNTFYYGSYNFPGLKKTDRQVDASGMLANMRFAAICDSLLTPANMQWHALRASDDYVMKDRATQLWFERVTNILFRARYAPTANFSGQSFANYLQLGAFGTMGMFIDSFIEPETGLERGLRYRSEPMGGLFITENHQGLVDGIFRWLRMTARQIFTRWGPTNFPLSLRGSLEQNSPLVFNVIHHVCRRADYDPQAIATAKGKPWASYYMYADSNYLLEENGYWSFPLACGRYLQAPAETYGRGWAMLALPALKTLNAQKRTFLKVGHRESDPILLTGDDGLLDGASLRPGSEIKGGMNSDGRPLVGVLPSGKIQTTLEMMQEERSLIDDLSLYNLFKVLEENPNMSATAVVELANQKGILMAPTMGRQQSEYLGSAVVREIDVLAHQVGDDGRPVLPPIPPRLREARGEYDVVYTTPMSRTMRMQEVAGSMRTIEMVKEMIAVSGDQSLLDPFAFNRMVPGTAEINAVPASWMATPAEMAAKAKQRAQSAQAAERSRDLPGQAAMLNAQTKAQTAQAAQPPGTFAPINLQQPQPAA